MDTAQLNDLGFRRLALVRCTHRPFLGVSRGRARSKTNHLDIYGDVWVRLASGRLFNERASLDMDAYLELTTHNSSFTIRTTLKTTISTQPAINVLEAQKSALLPNDLDPA